MIITTGKSGSNIINQEGCQQSMSVERSNTGKSAEGSNEANYYVQKAFKGIKELTQAEKSMKGLQSEIKIRKLNEINRNLEFAARKDPTSLALFRQNKVFIYIKHFFTENVSKTPALAFLRLLIPAQEDLVIYLNNNIPIFIARILERDEGKQRGSDWDQQITEALKLVAQWINHNPLSFPRLLASSLVCFAQLPAVIGFQQKKKYHISQQLKLLTIDILLSLTVNNLQLSLETGIFNLLLTSIIDPVLHERSQDILIRILFLMNQKSTREKIWPYIDLKKLFSVFTDLDFVFIQENSKNKGNIQFSSKLQTQLSLSKQALLTLLKSWNGIILLANDPSIPSDILESLKQIPKKQDSDIRKCIYSLLQELLGIGEGLMSEGVIHQENDFRASSLLSSYIIDLLRLLMNHGLFKLLIELSGIDQQSIAEPAQKLLKKLSIYIFNFLPDATKYMDFLISAGTKSGPGSSVLKYSSSFIVSKIGNYVFQDLKEVKNSFLSQLEYIFNPDSLFVPLNRISILAVSKNLNYLAYKEIPNYRRRLLDLKPIPKQFKENFKKWDWNTIIDLLSFPDVEKEGSKADSSDKYKEFKLFKYLLRFYSPMRGNFIEQRWTSQNLVYVKTGKLLIQNTLMIPDNLALVKNPPESQFQCTISFIGQIEKTLENALQSSSKNILKYYPPFFKTLQRQLILWIGSFTCTKIGYQSLICENNFFEMLQAHCKYKQCSFIIAGIMFYLDFYRDSLGKRCKDDGFERSRTIGPKALLIKAIKQGSKYLKLMSIQIIKLLYKGELVGFHGEGFRLLLLLAIEDSQEIWKNTIDTIEYLIKNKQLLQTLLSIMIEYELQNNAGFAKLKQKISSNIYIRLTGIPQGYNFIQQKYPQWLQKQYDRWVKPESSQKYFDNLEQLLNNCLNFSKKQPIGYRIETKKKDWLQWAFLYKLPWILHINDAEQVPLLIRINNESVELYAEFDDQGYDFRSSNSENIIKICLAIGGVYLDHHMNPIKVRHYTSINLNQNKLVSLYGTQYYYSSENGIQVYFSLKPRGESVQECSQSEIYSNNYDVKRIHIEIKLSSVFQIEELPLHLIQEITKTQMGMQFLEKKGLTEHSKKVLINDKSSALQMRSVLWSLGYYGSTKDGIAKLIQQEIINIIINMSMNCPTLSMRGTCRYVLNMFCHSEEGRNCLARHKFTVSKKLLSCFPTDSNLLFKINDNPDTHISENEKFWSEFKQGLVAMNQSQSKLYESISLLINSLSSKYAIQQIKETIKGGNKLTFSYNLLQNIVHLMSYFKMKYEARKTIHFIFDEFLKSNEFISQGNGKIDYVLG